MQITNYIGIIGLGLFLIGVFWLIFLSLKIDKSLPFKLAWIAANFFLNPFAGIFFYKSYKIGLIPVILCCVGSIFAFYGNALQIL